MFIRQSIITLTLVALVGCNAEQVKRDQEISRFREHLKQQTGNLKIDKSVPLTIEQCEQLALANSLDLSVKRLALKIQDDNVRIALSQGMPQGNLSYSDTSRSNPDKLKSGGTMTDKHQQNMAIGATIPILDYGLTYYSYQIAKDQRSQEKLLYRKSQLDLRRDVRVAYARYAGSMRQRHHAEIAYQASLQVLRVAKSLQNAELTVKADTSLVEAAVAQAELDQQLATQQMETSHIQLLQLMSLPPGTQFSIRDEYPNLPSLPTAEQIAQDEDRALLARPELAMQDLERHISANNVKRAFAEFFPRVDGVGAFNWSNNSQAVNKSYFSGGFQVSSGLLDGGATIWRYGIAKKNVDVQKQQALLLQLGVLYDVELRALHLRESYEIANAAMKLETARREALNRVISLYKEGLEDEAGAARALADLTQQATVLDKAQTEYQVAWYEFEAAVLPERVPTAVAATQPTSRPVNPLDFIPTTVKP